MSHLSVAETPHTQRRREFSPNGLTPAQEVSERLRRVREQLRVLDERLASLKTHEAGLQGTTDSLVDDKTPHLSDDDVGEVLMMERRAAEFMRLTVEAVATIQDLAKMVPGARAREIEGSWWYTFRRTREWWQGMWRAFKRGVRK